jgi:hypothetical protein
LPYLRLNQVNPVNTSDGVIKMDVNNYSIMDFPYFPQESNIWVYSQVPPNAPPPRLVEMDTLLLILRILVPNRMATSPIKKPVVTA